MQPLRTLWPLGKWCADCTRDILLCALWLLLAATLVLQLLVATSSQLPVPGWILRKIETRLATAGLRVQVGEATLDPAGRLALRAVKVFPDTLGTPLATVENFHVRLRLLSLFAGQVEPVHVRANGLRLLLPPMYSASGQTEDILSDIHLAFKPSAETLVFEQFSGRLANLTFELRGTIENPRELLAGQGKTAKISRLTPALLRRYFEHARGLNRAAARLSSLQQPHLALHFAPGRQLHLVLTSRKFETDLTPLEPRAGRLTATDLRLSTRLSFRDPLPSALDLRLDCALADATGGARLENASARLSLALPAGAEPPTITSAALAAAGVRLQDIALRHGLAEASRPAAGRLDLALSGEAAGTVWQAAASLDTTARAGRVEAAGAITRELVRIVATRLRLDPDTLLTLQTPAPLSIVADFSPGWQIRLARGHLRSGPFSSYGVSFHASRGEFAYDGTQLHATDLYLRHGDNYANGTYWMDTRTNRYEFLLAGRLRPLVISGWFGPWWKTFWNYFDFSPSVPVADVSIAGQWGRPLTTTIYAGADISRPTIRGVPFDRVRTRMFIRPDFYHADELVLQRGERRASGTFTRFIDSHRDAGNLKYLDFDLATNLDLHETASIFGPAGTETVSPFAFGQPPDLRIAGHIDGAASGRGSHRHIRLELSSTGPFALYKFPLADLSFKGTIRDDEIDLSEIAATFAGGRATGTARIYGPDTERRLSFDATLKDALLGEAISTLENYAARERGELPPAQSRFQQQNAQGRLNLDLAAQGLYSDLLSFYGHGHLDLTSAQLAQVNLLGSLSQLLSKSPVFRFTTLQLKEARCAFVLERDKLTFPDLKITGTNAIIDTSGTYQLDKKGMDFTARLYPFGQGRNPLASAAGFLLVPLTNALELKLSGPIDQPQWRFTYGPTSFLYNLTGSDPSEQPPADPNATDKSRKLPQPHLRR